MITKTGQPLQGAEAVAAYMHELNHPMQAEIIALQEIILGVDEGILTRVKWNAPSYYTRHTGGAGEKEMDIDFLTFHVRKASPVHLIFHHPLIVKIAAPFLEGDYKDRRMVYFTDLQDIHQKEMAFRAVISELLWLIRTAGK